MPARTQPKLADGIPVFCAYDELVPIESVVGNPRNPNTHPERQIALLAKIIDAQGWRAPITVSTRSGFVVRGHGRLMAARLLGKTHVPVDRQDYADEASEWADLVADNRLAELAEIDESLLHDMLADVAASDLDFTLTGFDEDVLNKLGMASDVVEDEPPEPPAEPVTRLGDLWLLGEHRVLCGDSTDPANVALAAGGASLR